ncbi:MAG: DNA repair and recombination protein RadA [Candidatus Heimdallarchaeota archaeon]|nr:DNA repair and recombination protein RadA [Candidatus Heimdallarchaeota archaeon]
MSPSINEVDLSNAEDISFDGLLIGNGKKKELPDHQRDKLVEKLETIDGIGPTTAKTMYERGMSYELLHTTPIRELVDVYGIPTTSATKYQDSIILREGGYFTSAFNLHQKQKITESFTYGVESIDELLRINEINNLGIIAGNTYEYFGKFRTGKSQICHQLCVTIQLPVHLGGIAKKAIYIDTEGTFSPSRIVNIVSRFNRETDCNFQIEEVLKNIKYARAMNSDQQRAIVYELLKYLSKHPNEYGLLIIDSVTSHFRSEYLGRGTLAERQQTLNQHLSILNRIAESFNLAVIITNQVQSNPNQFFGDPISAVGGNIIGHWAGTRIYLKKSKGNARIMKIIDSVVLGQNETVFAITEEGIVGIGD